MRKVNIQTAKKSPRHETKNKLIKNLLKEHLFTSLGQSIFKIFSTPHIILKVFLTIFILVSTGFASYLVIQSIMTYLSFGVVTTSRTIFETPTLFPKVTFCNINWITTEYGFRQRQKGSNNLSNEEKRKLGHDLNDILFECKFNDNPCKASDFTWSYDVKYGNCFTFNSGVDSSEKKVGLKKSNLAGPNFGLRLTLYVNIYEELLESRSSLGAIIRIGNSSYLTDNSNSGILISPGEQTFIAVEREFQSMLSKPHSNCEIDSDSSFTSDSYLFNLIAHSNFDYSQQFCFTQCLQNKFIKKYNCTLYYFISLYNRSQCSPDVEALIFTSADSFDSKFISETCLPLCPLECNQTLYKTLISSNKLNAKSFYLSSIRENKNLTADFINRSIDANIARESIIYVNIFYERLSYTLTTESPQMDIVSLLSSIGGNLGLFLEVSLFTLCEFVQVVIEMYFALKIKRQVTS